MTTPAPPDLPDLPYLPEQTAATGDPLPDLPASASPPDAVLLDPPDEVWTLANGDTIPKVLTLPPIPRRPTAVTVTFRDPSTLRAGDRKRAIAAMPEAPNRASAAALLLEATAVMMIEAWGFAALPIPSVAVGSLDQLEMPDYDAILDAIEPILELMFPNPTVTAAGPTRPSEPSSS